MVKRIITGIGKLCKSGEIFRAVKIVILVHCLPLFQRFLTLPRLVRFYKPLFVHKNGSISVDETVALTKRVLKVDKGILKPNCVKQSLILYHFFAKYNLPVKIFFGIQKLEGKLDGHAWITLDDVVIAEDAGDPFTVFKVVYSYPGDSTFDSEKAKPS